MKSQPRQPQSINRASYLRLLDPYESLLSDFSVDRDPVGRRFELLFLQIVDDLVRPEPFNLTLPSTFVATARRYRAKDAETVRHFQYDENRQFFLSDLMDWMQLLERRTGG